MQTLRDDVLGTVVAGDSNCYHSGRLRFLTGVTTEHRFLKGTCPTNGLLQKLSEPTRGSYLLDMCLNDRTELSACVLPSIGDHCCLFIEFTLQVDVFTTSRRSVWYFRSADW